ncbi:MAG: hypothetical protein ACFB2Z_10990 [Maricaulaceae bacterium]
MRFFNILAFLPAAALVVAVYLAKSDTVESAQTAAELQGRLAEVRRDIGVLQAEIAYLERPERIRELAKRHLGLEPLDARHQKGLSEAALLLEPDEDPSAPDPGFIRQASHATIDAEARP